MAAPAGAKIILAWDNGQETEIGTLEVKSEEKGTRMTCRVRMQRARFGWGLVRLGMKVMFPGKKWKEETK